MEKKFKIIFITHYNSMNGANQSLFTLINYIKDDIQIDKVIIYSEGNKNEGLYKKLKEMGIDVQLCDLKYFLYYSNKYVGFLTIPLKIIHNFPIWIKLYKELKKNNIDIVYSNSSLENTGILISKLLKIKHYWHIREFGYADYKYIHIGGDFLKRKILKLSNKLITISKSIDNYVCLPMKSNLVYNGIFSLNELKKLNKKTAVTRPLKLGMVGVIGPNKNQLKAIEIMNLLVISKKDVILNLYGSIADHDYYQKLLSRIKYYGLCEKISFTGFVSNRNDIYNNIDVLLMCSPHEAFGRVTVEAMAYGIPVVGYNNAGTAELIKDGYNGFLYNEIEKYPHDIIISLINDDLLYYKISNNTRLSAQEYSVEIYGRKILNLICN